MARAKTRAGSGKGSSVNLSLCCCYFKSSLGCWKLNLLGGFIETVILIPAELSKLPPKLAFPGLSMGAQTDSESQRWASPS